MASKSKVIMLKSSDNETFEVEEAVSVESEKIKHMIEDNLANTTIPLPNVSSSILAKVIEYCKKHAESPKGAEANKTTEDEIKNFDVEFVKVDQATLFNLIVAADDLKIQSLLMLTCQAVGDDMINGKTPEEARETYRALFEFGSKCS